MFKVITPLNQSLRFHGPVHILQDLVPLGIAEVSPSDFVRCDNLSKVFGAAYADQAGTLKIQFSADGVNIDHEETIDIAAATAAGGFMVDLVLPYVRLQYTNGGVAQTEFRCNLFGRGVS